MKKSSKSPARRTKLEPLSIDEALASPAVEGMFSFLEIRPEELIHPRRLAEVVRQAESRADKLASPSLPTPDQPGASPPSQLVAAKPAPGIDISTRPGLTNETEQELTTREQQRPPVSNVDAGPGLQINDSPGLYKDNRPGFVDNYAPGLEIRGSIAGATSDKQIDNRSIIRSEEPGIETYSRPGHEITADPGLESTESPGLDISTGPGLEYGELTAAHPPAVLPALDGAPPSEAASETQQSQRYLPKAISSRPGIELNSRPGQVAENGKVNYIPGLELSAVSEGRSLLVSEVRYTVRRAKLVQDGHTSNEQKLYEYLWAHGVAHDEVSRRVSIGFRTLAEKVRLARASAQKNLRALVQKLAVEIIEDFDVASSKPPTYRVFNYSYILKRRETAGMTWYVRRTQAVRFVDEQGREIAAGCRQTPGPVFNANPGQELPYPPGLALDPDPGTKHSPPPGPDLGPQLREEVLERTKDQRTSASTPLPSIPNSVITVLQEITSCFDNQAAELLWAECCAKVPDCTAEEVAYFANTKAAILRSGKIQNPVGFLITAVPKCFEGESFQHFRREQARLKEEQRRREEEERRRQQAIDDEMEQYRRLEEARGKAEQLLPTLPEEEQGALNEQAAADYKARRYTATGSLKDGIIRRTIIDILAKRILSEAQSTPT